MTFMVEASKESIIIVLAKLRQNFVGFPVLCFRCCEKDSLDGILRRIIAQKEANIQRHINGNITNITGGQGLWTSLKLLRGDPKQVSRSEIKLFFYIIV